jgi:hypothetical protein
MRFSEQFCEDQETRAKAMTEPSLPFCVQKSMLAGCAGQNQCVEARGWELIPENPTDCPPENLEIDEIFGTHQFDSEKLASFYMRLPDFDLFSLAYQFPRSWK